MLVMGTPAVMRIAAVGLAVIAVITNHGPHRLSSKTRTETGDRWHLKFSKSNRRLKFQNRRQLFICAHNETLPVAAGVIGKKPRPRNRRSRSIPFFTQKMTMP